MVRYSEIIERSPNAWRVSPSVTTPTGGDVWSHCFVILHHQDCSDISCAFPSPKSIILWCAWSVILIQEVIFLTRLVLWVRLNVFIPEWILYLFLPLAIKGNFITKVIRFSTSENVYLYFTDQRKWKRKNVELK